MLKKVKSLKNMGECFIDIHGKHDHQYMLNSRTHIEIVDNSDRNTIHYYAGR